jgi:hypothetical protein
MKTRYEVGLETAIHSTKETKDIMNKIRIEDKLQAALFFIMAIIAVSWGIAGCGQGAQGPASAPGASATSTTPDTVQGIVNDYNAWRTSNGQETIDPGLTCNLYTVPQTTTGITATANGGVAPVLTNVGVFTSSVPFNQPNASVTAGLNVLPPALATVYQTWFILKCTGYLVIATDSFHEFDVTSDDGSNLYVDGTLVVANDGLHGATDVTGQRHLQDTVHTFEIDYFQGGGNQSLIVNMDSALLPSENLYH